MEEYNIISIIGPTASGKTRLAVEIATDIDGEIISGDSRQVYKWMDIGTGKDLVEYNRPSGNVQYHLIDIVLPLEDYNLFRYINDFKNAYRDVISRKRIPILCGGSGLYIESALKGYNLPDAPEDKALRERLEDLSKEELIEILQRESSEVYFSTDLSSKRRIIRGIEIARYMKFNESPKIQENLRLKPLIIGISIPRGELIKRIDKRLDQRLKEGMIEEVKMLLDRGVTYQKLYKLGLEYRYCAMYLQNEIDLDEMMTKLKTEIHRFAKRQMTWFRGMERRGLKINWINEANPLLAMELIKEHSICV
ncbi:MAG TPA: tRNA (adenosine(37)-N6)-dimethylallyltransferase MiaA [Spirochaetota bacterium]|nr:tRNA (adenosine(37)-N6)-dimethylallyltransferase MiaA [Spirochaetota bacterium]HPD78433.1 tRNA (adenosine(37)-N6)-dimethylallyltransferase MiaA [Spirochaetota bacterium]HRS63177.1 tRNA (adenosine(37)-N6)-dimethylallyltransferase MiaA [Spirochaetota bacterium]